MIWYNWTRFKFIISLNIGIALLQHLLRFLMHNCRADCKFQSSCKMCPVSWWLCVGLNPDYNSSPTHQTAGEAEQGAWERLEEQFRRRISRVEECEWLCVIFLLSCPVKNRAGAKWLEPKWDGNTDSHFFLKDKKSKMFHDGPSLRFISVLLFLESSDD